MVLLRAKYSFLPRDLNSHSRCGSKNFNSPSIDHNNHKMPTYLLYYLKSACIDPNGLHRGMKNALNICNSYNLTSFTYIGGDDILLKTKQRKATKNMKFANYERQTWTFRSSKNIFGNFN